MQADNVGHKLLSMMGWKDGEGLGSAGAGVCCMLRLHLLRER